jgi:predicted nucleic acid-binding protein
MKYLFDASAIFKAIKENKTEVLDGNCTLDLARYELGNIVWKEYLLLGKISKEEAEILIRAITGVLNIMEILPIVTNEEAILATSAEHKITFYDASYTYISKDKKIPLITEDQRLAKRVASAVKVLSLSGFEG